MTRLFPLIALGLALSACGNRDLLDLPEIPVKNPSPEDFVLRSRMTIDISSDGTVMRQVSGAEDSGLRVEAAALGVSTNVTLVNGPNASMTVSTSSFVMPVVSNALLDLGSLAVATLFDNSLRICGSNGKTKCGTALLRVYTAGVAGAGLWNAADGYGAPLTVESTPAGTQTTGLGVANAVVVQSYAIPSNVNVLRQTNFSPAPSFKFKTDFTDVGAGSYATTIVIEYGLTL